MENHNLHENSLCLQVDWQITSLLHAREYVTIFIASLSISKGSHLSAIQPYVFKISCTSKLLCNWTFDETEGKANWILMSENR